MVKRIKFLEFWGYSPSIIVSIRFNYDLRKDDDIKQEIDEVMRKIDSRIRETFSEELFIYRWEYSVLETDEVMFTIDLKPDKYTKYIGGSGGGFWVNVDTADPLSLFKLDENELKRTISEIKSIFLEEMDIFRDTDLVKSIWISVDIVIRNTKGDVIDLEEYLQEYIW